MGGSPFSGSLPHGGPFSSGLPSAFSGGVGWTPRELSPLLWLRSDLGITITGAGVSTWADQSGNGNDATQTTDARRPTYATGQINGQPALAWVDTSTTKLALAGLSVPTNASVIVVGKLTSGKTGYRVLLQSGTSEPDVYYQLDLATDVPSLFWSGAGRNDGATQVNDGTWRALRWMWGASDLSIAYNNGAAQTASRGALTVAATWTCVGISAVDLHAFDGQIAELIVAPAELTTGQVTSLNAYLKARYALW